MRKLMMTIVSVVLVCSFLFAGCGKSSSDKDTKSVTPKKTSSKVQGDAKEIKSKETVNTIKETENKNNAEVVVDKEIVAEKEAPVNQSSTTEIAANENTASEKQAYLDKLSNLEVELHESLKEKYSSPVTADMVEAGSEEYSTWDSELNEIYSKLQQQLSKEDMDKLTAEEQQWISNRDEKAEEFAKQVEGGSAAQSYKLTSLIASTRDRCYELVNNYMK